MTTLHLVGETTITGKNQVSLPTNGIRELGWERGDRLLVEIVGSEMMILLRKPESWTEYFAGKLSHVFGTHDENLAWLAEERQSWEADG
jgi:hypothetical protein